MRPFFSQKPVLLLLHLLLLGFRSLPKMACQDARFHVSSCQTSRVKLPNFTRHLCILPCLRKNFILLCKIIVNIFGNSKIMLYLCTRNN